MHGHLNVKEGNFFSCGDNSVEKCLEDNPIKYIVFFLKLK